MTKQVGDGSRELWTCPVCGRSFVNANQWHSHGQSLDAYLADKTPEAIALFTGFAAAIRECGDYRMHPTKSRVAFITRMSFAGATLRRRWIDVGFILPYRSDSTRFRRIEDYGMKHEWAHYLRISKTEEIDGEVRQWACDAYRVGSRSTRGSAAVLPDPRCADRRPPERT